MKTHCRAIFVSNTLRFINEDTHNGLIGRAGNFRMNQFDSVVDCDLFSQCLNPFCNRNRTHCQPPRHLSPKIKSGREPTGRDPVLRASRELYGKVSREASCLTSKWWPNSVGVSLRGHPSSRNRSAPDQKGVPTEGHPYRIRPLPTSAEYLNLGGQFATKGQPLTCYHLTGWEGGPCPRLKVKCHPPSTKSLLIKLLKLHSTAEQEVVATWPLRCHSNKVVYCATARSLPLPVLRLSAIIWMVYLRRTASSCLQWSEFQNQPSTFLE